MWCTYIYAGKTLIHRNLMQGGQIDRFKHSSVANRELTAGLSPGSACFAKLLKSPSPEGEPPTTGTRVHVRFTYKLSIMGVDVQGLCTFEYRGMNFIR